METNEIQLEVGRPKVHEGKTGDKFLSFPIYLNAKGLVLILWGFRISRGRILPPAVRGGKGYFDLVEGNQEFAETLYQAIFQTGEEWQGVLQEAGGLLPEKDRATEMLLYTEKAVRLAFE